MENIKKKFLFEETTCSRCNGTGKYSWCQTYGDKCFKCSGKTVVLTKRGEAAQAYFNNLCTKQYKDVKIGDLIEVSPITNSGNTYRYYATVIDINPSDIESSSLVDGVWQQDKSRIAVKTSHVKYGETSLHTFPECDVKYRDETIEDKKKQALEYQNTLTKMGKPRKNKK